MIKVNGVSLFTKNSKTACPSWAVSTRSCKGCHNATICKSCYAKKGMFCFPAVKNAVNKRLEWWNKSQDKNIIETMTNEIRKSGTKYFRAYVSGDFQGSRDIRIWRKIAENLPEVKFWFPTKAHRVRASGITQALQALNRLENVSVRPSSGNFDTPAPDVKGLAAGTTAHKKDNPPNGEFNCIGDCSKCRVCWDKETKVSYHYH